MNGSPDTFDEFKAHMQELYEHLNRLSSVFNRIEVRNSGCERVRAHTLNFGIFPGINGRATNRFFVY
jgi:hypothetical protein